ncbi:MAG: hypothetical protein PHU28_02605 [Methanosarcinaceae archaeon]|nr:hypothetical protein [Methanosarcinaceae archaeon]
MIIRIMEEGQFRISGKLYDELNALDNRIVDFVAEGKKEAFKLEFSKMIEVIRTKGKPLLPEELLESEIIVPPEDLSFEEAREVFIGSGIFEA